MTNSTVAASNMFLSVPTTYRNEPMRSRYTNARFCIQNIYFFRWIQNIHMLTTWKKKSKESSGALPLRLAGLYKGWENDVFSCGLGCRCRGHILNLLGSKVASTYGRLAYAFFLSLLIGSSYTDDISQYVAIENSLSPYHARLCNYYADCMHACIYSS
jgi:hypothetical protein